MPFLQRNGVSRALALMPLMSSTSSGWLWDQKQWNSLNSFFNIDPLCSESEEQLWSSLCPNKPPQNSWWNSKVISWTGISPRGAGAPPEEHFTHSSKRSAPGNSYFLEVQLSRGSGWLFMHTGNQRRTEELSNCRSWMPVSAFFPCDILNLVSKRLLRNVFFWHFDIISSLCVEYIIWFYQNKAIRLTPHDSKKKKKALGKNGNSCIFVPV